MTDTQKLSLELIKEHFKNISDEEFLESYLKCEKNIGPAISTFDRYLKENISSKTVFFLKKFYMKIVHVINAEKIF